MGQKTYTNHLRTSIYHSQNYKSYPAMPATLASGSKIDASHKARSISAINDRLVPKDENDRSMPYYH